MITLANILLYPIKSLDGIVVQQAKISPGGALEHDRRYALVDSGGKIIHAKRTAKMHSLRCSYDLAVGIVQLSAANASSSVSFHLDNEREEINRWFSQFLDMPVRLIEDRTHGFPDDKEAFGPTVASTASLAEVSAWFPDLSVEECRQRFRANLELAECEPFWEDRLFGDVGSPVRFTIGRVQFEGVNPCQRCVVPSRSPRSGEATVGFQQQFSEYRKLSVAAHVAQSRFDHYYRFAVNTRIPASEAGKVLHVGDAVTLTG
jgi:uncharacterized protein YcbX